MSRLTYFIEWVLLITVAVVVALSEQQVTTKDLHEPYCSPPPNSSKTHYLIGYGSLLNAASKGRTYPDSGESIPVTIKGFSRRWNAQSGGVSMGITYLGAVETPSSNFNGIVFEVKSNDIKETLRKFDLREEWYCRHRVDFERLNFTAWNSSVDDSFQDGEFWIYVNRLEHIDKPSPEFPIVQSYVDVFLTGCLEVESKFNLQGFTRQCISTTQDWGFHWVNDRVYPRRAFRTVPKAGEIDFLLAEIVPKQFGKIVLE